MARQSAAKPAPTSCWVGPQTMAVSPRVRRNPWAQPATWRFLPMHGAFFFSALSSQATSLAWRTWAILRTLFKRESTQVRSRLECVALFRRYGFSSGVYHEHPLIARFHAAVSSPHYGLVNTLIACRRYPQQRPQRRCCADTLRRRHRGRGL